MKIMLKTLLAALMLSGLAWAAASEPIVALDAAKLAEGPLAAWENGGSLKGSFCNDGTAVSVAVVDGIKAVVFKGADHMTADFKAPASLAGDKPWSCIVKTRCTELSRERALVAWANRPVNCLELEYGEALRYGAVGTWNDPNVLGWTDGVPVSNQWHTLVYTYQGGANGELQAWSDGELRAKKNVTLSTKEGKSMVIGACILGGEANEATNYVHAINGAIASVRIYDRAMTPVEIWNASGKESACQVAPDQNARLETLTTTLKWFAGKPGVASFDVYLGNERAAVEKAENTQPAGKVYKGSQPVAKTEYGPVDLTLGVRYFWRIDQRDASGKVINRGDMRAFATETGQASDPMPVDGYIVVEGGKTSLGWKPGKYAEKQNVYVGTSAEEVLAKTKPDAADLSVVVTNIPLPLKEVAAGKTYYWRVDSVNKNGLPVSKGAVWAFRAVKKKIKVYLLGGQSNAVGCSPVTGMPQNLYGVQRNVIVFIRGECRLGPYGWGALKDGLGSGFGDNDGRGTIGPELTFGINMRSDDPGEAIAIMKCAFGGTNLGAQWRPPSAGGTTGELYTKFVAAVREGMAALDPAFEPEIAGMIWMQGESDSGDTKMAEEYGKNLMSLIKDIRAEVKKPNMPFVFAQIAKAPAWDNPPMQGEKIRAGQRDVSGTVPNTATFSTEGYGMCDPWHYDTAGMVSLGERFAEAMKRLEKDKK